MRLKRYMDLLSETETIPNDNFHKFERSEKIDKLIVNYEKVYKASNNDEGNKIYSRLLILLGA